MNTKLKYSKLIEKYLNGEMDEAEIRDFLSGLKEDKVLAEEFRFDSELTAAIEDEGMLEFRQMLMELIRDSKDKKGVVRTLLSRPYRIAAAASILLLLAATWFLFLTLSHPSNDKLFSNYYDSDQPLRMTRRSGTELVEALRNYQDKDFIQAIEQFNQILETDSRNSAVQFYASICYIETGQFDDAIRYLSDITSNTNSLYNKPAEWYLGLCYLKTGRTNEATEIFRKIASDPIHDFQKDAAKILSELNKRK
ncbi:MAG: tetratricopeptide repeat protein [Bacteroidales bacterium]|nr:tetratricopeptide repeat protein [Lentimicrobiaceae bacterium]MDD5694191.1 tetratricopeptide repeat protein [Bacteroidales bacterium]